METATANIIKAIEVGIINNATKNRLDELENQKNEITAELADLNLAKSVRLTRDQVVFFLYEYRKGDFNDREFQKRLIDTFVNSVFVYDDEVTLTFNYSGDGRTVTLKDVDGDDGDVFVCCHHSPTIRTQSPLIIRLVGFAFVLISFLSIERKSCLR